MQDVMEMSRVRHEDGKWVVEIMSAAIGRWIVQGVHNSRAAADADLKNWR